MEYSAKDYRANLDHQDFDVLMLPSLTCQDVGRQIDTLAPAQRNRFDAEVAELLGNSPGELPEYLRRVSVSVAVRHADTAADLSGHGGNIIAAGIIDRETLLQSTTSFIAALALK